MINISYKLDTSGLDALARKLEINTEGALSAIAHRVEAEVKGNIVAKDIIDTGAFLGSIHVEHLSEKVKWVTDGVEYGIYQELGTSRIAARPTFVPAVEAVASEIGAIIQEEIFS